MSKERQSMESDVARKVSPEEQRAAMEQLKRELYGGDEGSGKIVAVIVSVIIHLVLLLSLPHIASLVNEYGGAPTASWDSVYEVQFEGVTFDTNPAPQEEAEELPQKFVETNPDVPENKPDETINFAARDQQSAQPERADVLSEDNSPQLEAEDMLPDSPKIVEGMQQTRDEEAVPPPGYYAEDGQDAASPAEVSDLELERTPEVAPTPSAPAQTPDALRLDREKPLDGEGFASYFDPAEGETYPEVSSDTETEVISLTPMNRVMAERMRNQADSMTAPRQDGKNQPSPLPRPRIVPKVSPGPLRESPGGVTKVGAIAIDANFSEYGDYLQRMFDAISLHWNNLNEDASRSYAEMRSKVVVEFYITSTGSIHGVRVLNSNADRLRTLFCEEAIRARAPFGEWPTDMKTALGSEQPIRITFFYR